MVSNNCLEFLKTILKRSENTINVIESKVNAGDVNELCLTVSLMCPLSKRRMDIPCRSCDHLQCFDALTFFELAVKSKKWKCPLCLKAIAISDLKVDTQLLDIVNNTSPTFEQVTFQADGSWREHRKRKIVPTAEQPKKSKKKKKSKHRSKGKSPSVITIE